MNYIVFYPVFPILLTLFYYNHLLNLDQLTLDGFINLTGALCMYIPLALSEYVFIFNGINPGDMFNVSFATLTCFGLLWCGTIFGLIPFMRYVFGKEKQN
jgi:hypothetical protein